MAFIATEELRAAILIARSAALNAEIEMMRQANLERSYTNSSLAYTPDHFIDAVAKYGLHENDVILLTCHGETA